MTMLQQAARFANDTWRRFLKQPSFDIPLMVALLMLCTVGIIVLSSAAGGKPSLVWGQAARVAFGFALIFILLRIPPVLIRNWTPWLFLGSLGLLLLVPLFGSGRSAKSWLNLGFFYVQPAELLKLTVPMAIAWFLHHRALPPNLLSLLGCLGLIGVPTALIAIQPDLGTAVIVAASGAFVIFLSGLSWRWIALLGGLVVAAAPLGWHFLHEYQKQRLRMFLDPESDHLGAGWNIIQSEIAVGSGGWTGKGLAMSSQAKLNYLPEHTTDFIFAVFAEEFGWIGVSAVIFLYLFIIGRGLWIAATAKDAYSRLLAGSLSMTFFVYVVVNGGMITGLMPVVGVPMPLISYGGTSAVTLLAGFGILFSIHAHRRAVGG